MSNNPDHALTTSFPAVPDVSGTQGGGYEQDVYVDFGPGADQFMPLSWAEKMLAKLYADNPRLFARLLTDILIPPSPNGQK